MEGTLQDLPSRVEPVTQAPCLNMVQGPIMVPGSEELNPMVQVLCVGASRSCLCLPFWLGSLLTQLLGFGSAGFFHINANHKHESGRSGWPLAEATTVVDPKCGNEKVAAPPKSKQALPASTALGQSQLAQSDAVKAPGEKGQTAPLTLRCLAPTSAFLGTRATPWNPVPSAPQRLATVGLGWRCDCN